jgi:transaldolase
MKATQRLHDLGQSLWLDNITRGLLTKGTLRDYITELSVTGLTTKVGYSKLREEIWQ